jgi:MSHA biogenesis protein MshI
MRDGSRIELAVVRHQADGSLSIDADNVESDREDIDWARDSHAGINHEDLRNARVSTVLHPETYSMQLVESPDVPAAEMRDAVRWRIQNLIEFPIAEAAISIFEMPAQRHTGGRSMIHAVVAHRDEIIRQIESIKRANLSLDVIDIPELCVRNVAIRLPQDADGVAFLHFTDDCGYLTITRKGVLYMIRRIETRLGELADAPDDFGSRQERSAGVALEVQRSLDFYESHYDCPPVNELVLGPGPNLETHASTLVENLGIQVSRLNLDDLFTVGTEIRPEVQRDCLVAIGAALRSPKIAAAA